MTATLANITVDCADVERLTRFWAAVLDRKIGAETSPYFAMLPPVQPDEWRRIRGEQDIIVRYEPERALETLPALVADSGDRDRLVALYQRLLADKRFLGLQPTEEQNAMLGRARDVLRARYAVDKPKSPVRPARAG